MAEFLQFVGCMALIALGLLGIGLLTGTAKLTVSKNDDKD